jgi:DNA-binding winged helix-turn-helix (wHTH) protein
LQSLAEFCDIATEVLLNRKPQGNGVVAIGDVVFTLRSSTVTVAGRERFLPPTTAVVFKLLVNNAGVVVSRDALAQAILEASQQQTTASHYVDKHVTYQIYALRKNLGQFRRRIVTVKGIGYKYENDQIDVRQTAKIAGRLN